MRDHGIRLPLAAAFGIGVVAGVGFLSEAAEVAQLVRHDPRQPRVLDAGHLARAPAEVEADQVGHRERPHVETEVVDHLVHLLWQCAVQDDLSGLARVAAENVVADESGRVQGHDGDLADGLAERHGRGEGFFAGFHSAHHLQHLHDVGGAEEVCADHVAGALRHRRHLVQVETRGVAGQHRALFHGGVELGEDLLLEVQVLVDGFDDDVRVRDGIVVQHSLDETEARVPLRFADPAAPDHAAVVVLDDGQPLVECLLVHFQHLHRYAGIGKAHGDAAAHQSAADGRRGADLFLRRVGGHVRNPRRLALGEEDVDHRRPLLVGYAAQEVRPLGAYALVEVFDLDGPLDGVERHLAVELAAHPPRQVSFRGLEHIGVGAVGVDLVALVANEGIRSALGDRGLGKGDGPSHQIAVDNRVDEAEFERLFSVEGIAGKDRLQCPLDADQPWHALGAAAARQQSDLDLGQTDRRAGCRDPVMARQRDLEAAAEGGAVDGGDNGLFAFLDVCARLPFRLLVPIRCAEFANVGAGNECAPLARDDDGFHGVVGERRLHVLRQIETYSGAQWIHRRVVDGEQRNAVAHFVVDCSE